MTPYTIKDRPVFLDCGCWVISTFMPRELRGYPETMMWDKRDRAVSEAQLREHCAQHMEDQRRAARTGG